MKRKLPNANLALNLSDYEVVSKRYSSCFGDRSSCREMLWDCKNRSRRLLLLAIPSKFVFDQNGSVASRRPQVCGDLPVSILGLKRLND